MLTPIFEISQTEHFVVIVIRAPFANVSETEIYVDECDFKFYSKPYYLRLTLPGPIVEDGQESAQYKSETASFHITFPKANPGEHFADLDLLTKLLAPSGVTTARQPMVEVLGGDDDQAAGWSEGVLKESDVEPDEETESGEEGEFDWQVEQEPYEETTLSLDGPKYGFANQRSGVLRRLQSELHEVIDLKNADDVPMCKRCKLRTADEDAHFSGDHYWSDMFDSEEIAEFLEYKAPWSNDATGSKTVEFTDYEKEVLLKLPRKEYLLDPTDTHCALMGLVDILFAYAYDHRTTEGENTVESGWTIAKLSATLSWFECFSCPRDVLVACHRRSLCFPLYRHWRLAQRVSSDVQDILTAGRRHVLKCLIDVRRLFIDGGDQRYILNDLYIDDYCTWIQHVSDKKLQSLAEQLNQAEIAKSDVRFDLEELELAGRLALEQKSEEEDGDNDQNVSNPETSSDDDSSSTCDSDDDSSTDSSSEYCSASDLLDRTFISETAEVVERKRLIVEVAGSETGNPDAETEPPSDAAASVVEGPIDDDPEHVIDIVVTKETEVTEELACDTTAAVVEKLAMLNVNGEK